MGVLRPILALGLPVLLAAADPAPAEIRARVPGKGRATVRLLYRRGIQVERTGLPPAFLATKGREAWISYEDLSPEGKRWALMALWPEDTWGKEEVRHHVAWPELESVWLLSSLFCSHGQNHDRLQEANPRNTEKLHKGDVWRIPRTLLAASLGGPVKGILERHLPEDDLEDEARIAAYRALLTFRDGHAEYRLRKGEALYSSVVIRYTDRVDPKEVQELALELARKSGIEDVRSIQPGTLIRIPVAHLAAPFQPEGTTALKEEREVREEVRRTVRLDAGPKLKGVSIVLDAGHGGVDPGAMANGVWESDHVYDIAMRLRELIQENSEAHVASTIRYGGVGFKVRDRIPSPTREASLLTTPPFANDGEGSNATSVHLRWVLGNDILAAHGRKGDARKTLFISLHADSLHPSARGTMVYVPGAALVPAAFSLGASRGAAVAEMKRGGKVAFSPRERLQGEARSRLFAEAITRALKTEQLPIHANRPIRSVIHRGGKGFLPAVIRYSNAATKVLVEVANLQNEEDADNLRDPAFRQRYAEALFKAIRAYFGT